MKNLLVATINHNTEDRRIKIVCRKIRKDNYQWIEAETGLDTCCPVASTLIQAKNSARSCWGSDAWQLKAKWY